MASLTSLPPELQMHTVHLTSDSQPDLAVTLEEPAQNNEAFTETVLLILCLLSSWGPAGNEAGTSCRGIRLILSAASPTDAIDSHGFKRRHRKVRWERSCIGFLVNRPRDLPVSCLVSTFSCTALKTFRNFSLAAICAIASCLPNVHTLDWGLGDLERHGIARGVEMREEFAKGLMELPRNVRHFALKFDRGVPLNHHWSPPQLYHGDPAVPDPLSVSLRYLMQRLETLEIKNDTIIGSEIFWPSSSTDPGSHNNGPVGFPNLRHVVVCAGIVSPYGSWLCSEDPSVGAVQPPNVNPLNDDVVPGDEGEAMFRLKYLPGLVEPYHLAAACAASRMPRLNNLEIMWSSPRPACLEYIVRDCGAQATLKFYGSLPLELTGSSEKAWREAVKVHVGDENSLDMDFIDEGNNWQPPETRTLRA
ncbi:hypothetical protein JX265_012730 [Neoarthrinium moseri]|uniref:DUF6546 domain-containing protein n=1 Tax=Neoarthrinium moseri TaxID=1658444 RepID=A0A9P9WA31_9PEZI|nr:hypothetical protein JX265_012730 [Neoarthrinium moseri]